MRSSVRLWDSQTSPAETSMCICETELDTPWRTELLGHVWKRHSGRNDWFDRKWQLQLGKHSGLPHSQQNWASLESEVPNVFLSTYLEHFGRTNNRKPKSKPACLIETRSREFERWLPTGCLPLPALIPPAEGGRSSSKGHRWHRKLSICWREIPDRADKGHLEDSKPRDFVLWSHVGDVWPSRYTLVKLRISTDGRNWKGWKELKASLIPRINGNSPTPPDAAELLSFAIMGCRRQRRKF